MTADGNSPTDKDPSPNAAVAALERLRAGNERFVAGTPTAPPMTQKQLHGLEKGQHPFAIVLGCSDSRVPAEIVFDQGLGDLFVIRIAGNIVAPSQIGSVEFAAATFDTALVVVLGHSNCGVIKASLDALRHEPGLKSAGLRSRGLDSITDRVIPHVAPLLEIYEGDEQALVSAATRTNVLASMDRLRRGSSIIRERLESGRLMIAGALYDLHSGVVDFMP